MDTLTTAKFVAGLIAAVGGPSVLTRLLRATFPDQKERLRSEIERNVGLLAKLPANSDGHRLVLNSVEKDLRRLVTDLDEARRDPFSIVLGIVFLALAAAAGTWGWQLDGWGQIPVWIGTVTLAIFGIVGITLGAPQTIRDEKGNAV